MFCIYAAEDVEYFTLHVYAAGASSAERSARSGITKARHVGGRASTSFLSLWDIHVLGFCWDEARAAHPEVGRESPRLGALPMWRNVSALEDEPIRGSQVPPSSPKEFGDFKLYCGLKIGAHYVLAANPLAPSC